MDRRTFLGALAASTSLPLGLSWSADRKRPNIVLCMADDQGWGDVGYNGHPTLKTPNLDEAAASGLRFDRFYAAAPVCSPTRGSIMTGRHPNRYGCFSWGHPLRPRESTLAETLKGVGYTTGHFGKWHLGSVQVGSPVNPGASGFDEWLSAPNFYDNDPILSREGQARQYQGESSMVAADAAINFIRAHHNEENPFLAVVWFGSPHKPHEAIEEDKKLYPDQPKALKDFYGEISGLDRAFGKLRKEIHDLGIAENTILWYCSDNGGLPEVGSTGGRGHKGDIYEGGLRVPAFVEWPRQLHEPRTTDLPCNTCDLYPTLVEIAGAQREWQLPLDGVSLLPLFSDQMAERGRGMGFWDYPVPGIRTPSKEILGELFEAQKRGEQTVRPELLRMDADKIEKRYPTDTFPGHAAWLEWPWKLHRIEPEERGAVTYELYQLNEDPMEERDLFSTETEKAKQLQEKLREWQVSVVDSLNGEDY